MLSVSAGAMTRYTGPGAIGVPQIEQRRSIAQISVRAAPVMANVGWPSASRGVIAGIG